MEKFKLGFIGFGNMATAICKGILQSKIIEKNQVCIFDVDSQKCENAKIQGIFVCKDTDEIAKNCEFVFLCIKPQSLNEIKTDFCNNKIISILAGVKIERIKKLGATAIARVMPNAAAMVSQGAAGVCFENMADVDKEFVKQIFSSVGICVETEEKNLNAVTATSGSGPAYVYYFMNCMIESAKRLGLKDDIAKLLVAKTFEGAVKMTQNSDLPLQKQIDFVCSKGGTTIEAIKVFDEANLKEIIDKAMENCNNRAEELSK